MRGGIAGGRESVCEFLVAAGFGGAKIVGTKIVKFGVEVGEVVHVFGDLFFVPIDFGEFFEAVEGDLGLAGLAGEGGVPDSAVGVVEAAALRVRMGEGGIHDLCVGDTEDEFMETNAGEASGFREQALVGRAVEFKERVEVAEIVREAIEHAAGCAIARGNEAVSVVLAEVGERGQVHESSLLGVGFRG